MAHELHPYKMSSREWEKVRADIVSRYGLKYLLSSALKRDFGWSPRSLRVDWDHIYIDFWEPEARSAFLIEYGNRDLDDMTQ